jgi:hypothetical protein
MVSKRGSGSGTPTLYEQMRTHGEVVVAAGAGTVKSTGLGLDAWVGMTEAGFCERALPMAIPAAGSLLEDSDGDSEEEGDSDGGSFGVPGPAGRG